VTSRVESPHAPSEYSESPFCPICHIHDVIACAPGRDRLFGLAQGLFALFRCKSCGCVFQHPLPEEATLADFYPREYWWSEKAGPQSPVERLFQRLEKSYREFVVAGHVRFLDLCARENAAKGKRLLDIGCGSGTFLHVAQSRGFVPHGMDRSPQAVEIAHRQYGYPVRQGEIGSKIWGEDRFDFVTMFHVLEHLRNPRSGLMYAGELLQPAGILIIQVPNVSSIQARLFGNLWYGLDVPRHVINFTPRALGLLLREMGFEFRLTHRFSVRDNPASVVSSLVPWLDPIRRKGRRMSSRPLLSGAMDIAYFGLFTLALPAAFMESACGYGGTIWACARLKKS
jgi:2-polyprenyl-3-methyl-5-hydroxy-6-metoxy-1,4-benzoquinol methylase